MHPNNVERCDRRWSTRLTCGVELHYRESSFLPRVGEMVPCPRHGYCPAGWAGGRENRMPERAATRARPRTPEELLDQLRREPTTTVAGLRRQRFSLRLIAAAARDGQLRVDSLEPEATVALLQGRGQVT
jgi:hypothetical protein